MNCLRKEEIYLYLEGEMDIACGREAEEHFLVCSRCREAYEERKALTEAARKLPDLEVPAGFARKIMARIGPSTQFSRGGLLTVFLAALSLFILSGLVCLLTTGGSLAGLAIGIGRTGLSLLRNASLIIVECVKLAALAFKLFPLLTNKLIETLARLNSLIKPEVYGLGLFSVLAIVVVLLCVLRGKGFLGEKP